MIRGFIRCENRRIICATLGRATVHQTVKSVVCNTVADSRRSYSGSVASRDTAMSEFRFSDYDCIGFDLDSTILRYNITNLTLLEYNVITRFLIEKKGYNPKWFEEPLNEKDFDFMQKGLVYDFDRGNVLKLRPDGSIYNASHGTKFLSTEQIEKYYPDQKWEVSAMLSKDPLVTWNGPLSMKIRTFLDCFDAAGGYVFAKTVDAMDKENGGPVEKYDIWPDILDAFCDMYIREQLQRNAGNFFSEMKQNPAKYIHKCNPETLAWIKKIKETKKTFLITGSNSDFVKITTDYAFTEDWKSIFDIIVCYAKKPGFFNGDRPFYSVKNFYEDKVVSSEELQVGQTYNQGNWNDLLGFFSRITGKSNPKCLYVGDNLLQDVYAPTKCANCDTMVISEEQLAEGMLHHDLTHQDEDILNSKVWGSFFTLEDPDGYKDSFWNNIIKKYSKLCIPKLELITHVPFDQPLSCFVQEDNDKELHGYHPAKPSILANLK